jgi:hypothetical protein
MAKKLFAYCGMQLGEQTEKFVSASTTRQHNAYYAVYKDPVKAAYHWREKLSNDDIAKIEATLNGSLAFAWYKDDFSDSRT